jgi:hypothetical protein
LKSYLEEIIAAPGLENREYGRGDPLRRPRDILYPQKLALTSPTCGGRSVGIVLLRTKTMEDYFGVWYYMCMSEELKVRRDTRICD